MIKKEDIELILSRLNRGQGKSVLAQFITCYQIYSDIYKYGEGTINFNLDPDCINEDRKMTFIHCVKDMMKELFNDIEIDIKESTKWHPIWRKKDDNRN